MKKLMKLVFGVWSLLLGAGVALAAEPVSYLDWNWKRHNPDLNHTDVSDPVSLEAFASPFIKSDRVGLSR